MSEQIPAVVVAEGSLTRLKEVQRMLARAEIEARVFCPSGHIKNS